MALNVPITEQYVIACILEKPSILNKIENDYFLSESAKSIYNSIKNLYKKNVTLTSGNIALEAVKLDRSITPSIIDSIRKMSYDLNSFDHYYSELKINAIRDTLKTNTISNLVLAVDNKDSFNHEDVNNLFKEGKNLLSILHGDNRLNLVHPSESVGRLINDLESKSRGDYNSTGSIDLDKMLGEGLKGGELVLIFARTSMGKTAFAIDLAVGMMHLRIPCISINLEMSELSSTKRLASRKLNMPLSFWSNLGVEDKAEHFEQQKFMLKKLREDLKQYSTFKWTDRPSLSLDELEDTAKNFREEIKLPIEKPLNMIVDLLPMITDYKKGASLSSANEIANDKLNEIIKRQNIAMIGVLQANRDTEGDKKIKSLKDINQFRPSLTNLKNSGSFEERARVVLSVFRPKYYIDRYLPEYTQMMDDILEVTVLKNSDGIPGQRLKYLTDLSRLKFSLYEPEDPEDDPNSLE